MMKDEDMLIMLEKNVQRIRQLFSGPSQEDRQWPFSSERGKHGEQPDACRHITETCREGR